MTDDGRALLLLYISREAFQRKPQVGVPCSMPWESFAVRLAHPSVGDDKGAVGGFALGRYMENTRRKDNLVAIGGVSLDFDASVVGDVARALVKYDAIVHETFSSTADGPRCRAFVLLSEPIEAPAYERLHTIMRAKLHRVGLPPDESAKDCSRLCYAPVRRPGASYAFRVTHGEPLDGAAVLRANPPPPPRPAQRLPDPRHANRYVAGALRRAAEAVLRASPGERHGVLCRESFALARLAVDEPEIRAALLEPFVAVAGEHRRREAERTIRDCVRARRGVSVQ